MVRSARSGVALALFAWSLAGGPASAADGVVEISQAQALAGGVTPGDAAGFPVTLGQAGSYVLTGDLVVANVNTSAIEVTADGVSLDLNGFRLAGAVTCSGLGSQLLCGRGTGVGVSAAQRARVSVRNGRVSGFGKGLDLGPRARVTQLHAASNGGTGIAAGSHSIVTAATAHANAGDGINVGSGSVVQGSTASSNREDGIGATPGVTILESAAVDNGERGISTGGGSAIRGNTAQQNESDGIFADEGCAVVENVAQQNGGNGVFAGPGSTVQRNAVRANTLHGLALASDASYRGNTITGNTAGTVSGGVNMLANSCNGAATCP